MHGLVGLGGLGTSLHSDSVGHGRCDGFYACGLGLGLLKGPVRGWAC